MKFELNKRTGMVEPKKNKQIYFSRSMSGGLRVDDHINNIKFIVERGGNIKYISGEHKVNIYDHRNANIIADRVKRMFGSGHEYANYKRFLNGYHLIESYEEFNEGLISKTLNRHKSSNVRKEEGIAVETPIGKVILGDKGCGLPYKIDKDNDLYYYVIDGDTYIFGYEDDDTYTYFEYNTESAFDEDGLLQIATSDYDMSTNNFITLRAMFASNFTNNEDLEFITYSDYVGCSYGNEEFLIFDDYNRAEKKAIENTKSIIEETGSDKESIDRWINFFGNDFLDIDNIESFMREYYENYVNEIENEDGTYGNRLFDELIENDIIDDNDRYFGTDEDGELDYDDPLFSVSDKKDELVDILCDSYDDPLDWYTSNFDSENLKEFIDIDKLVELIIDFDGICNSLGCDKEFEYQEDGYEIYIYRR